ncbi:MAG: FAD-binding oxidoreductase [Rhodospirillales bacterium]|nr:FAD-binding oxidoreductase [Rhodospirillales bacterium]
MTETLSGWGRFPRLACETVAADTEAAARAALAGAPCLIARGNGRAYGDAALNPERTLLMRPLAGVETFDPATGAIVVRAGTLLADLIALYLPRRWFPPVVPGTGFVTIGGMIAADVHGKNHHRAGSFGAHLDWIDLLLASGEVRRCAPDRDAELFAATCGGMGLTGTILRAAFRMMRVESGLVRAETRRAPDLGAAMDWFEASADWTYSVAWIDCLAGGAALGRSVLTRGEHATAAEAPAHPPPRPRRARRLGFDFPGFALNRWSVRAFNALYYRAGRERTELVDQAPFFHPLDAILDWNRMYGRAGLFQYQCVLPLAASRPGLVALLRRIAAASGASFLSVLKRFGPPVGRAPGPLSFPMEGYTLALDFRVTAANLKLAETLDAIVADHGGRLYLAKDARMSPAMLRFYPGLDRFRAVRDAVDPDRRFASALSRRLDL